MNSVRFAAAIVLLAVVCACRANVSATHDVAGADAVLAEIIAADNAGDVDRVLACYSDAPMLMPPNEAVVEGRDAVRARYAKAFTNYRFEFEASAFETHLDGKLGWMRGETRGRLHSKTGGDDIVAHDKFLAALERDSDGRWRIARLMWSPIEAH